MKKLVALATLALSFATTSAFAETLKGTVADAMCAKNPSKISADHAACAGKCIKGGEKPVLVVGEKVYTITNPETLIPHAGHAVTVEGTVKGDALTVASVKM